MRLLLDTHAILWWLEGSPRLPKAMVELIGRPDTEALASVVSVFEIATNHRSGKLVLSPAVAEDLLETLRLQGFAPLALDAADALRAGRLPGPRRDPFDRLLIAQALGRDLPFVTNEVAFDGYGVRRLW